MIDPTASMHFCKVRLCFLSDRRMLSRSALGEGGPSRLPLFHVIFGLGCFFTRLSGVCLRILRCSLIKSVTLARDIVEKGLGCKEEKCKLLEFRAAT
jgi:hypothetical protein